MTDVLIIYLKGIVQGVGMRPTIWRVANTHHIAGWVLNSTQGVTIRAIGSKSTLEHFIEDLKNSFPPASKVTHISVESDKIVDDDFERGTLKPFYIKESNVENNHQATHISPDLATCSECRKELLDPNDRRYLYPFINCTNCGPRFTIIKNLPYDRKRTSMDAFKMCTRCSKEYFDPNTRRFDAQPNACFDCGPSLSWYCESTSIHTDTSSEASARRDTQRILNAFTNAIEEGKIIALKGLGGFHLACDAQNDEAVLKLRTRKNRPHKPFAIMVKDLNMVHDLCSTTQKEEELLTSSKAPIVLLQKRNQPKISLSKYVAMNLSELGIMLPYTPLHILLFENVDRPLIMTSANVSGEPICKTNDEAFDRLGSIADAFLTHNRDIVTHYDDSVVRVINNNMQTVRAARGITPLMKPLPSSLTQLLDKIPSDKKETTCILATGPQQKHTFTLSTPYQSVTSQHIGDLQNAKVFDSFLTTLKHYTQIFDMRPTVLACDAHPEYTSSKWAFRKSKSDNLTLHKIYHHHAHTVCVMAEHNLLDREVIGVSLDGTGFGTDGTLWGGEILRASIQHFERLAHLSSMPLPGGEQAVIHPTRIAFGMLYKEGLLNHPGANIFLKKLDSEEKQVSKFLIDKNLNTPLSTSVGRLFDAISALLGICSKATYDAEPAILLEAMAQTSSCCTFENLTEVNSVTNVAHKQTKSLKILSTKKILCSMLDGLAQGTSTANLAYQFHINLSDLLGFKTVELCKYHNIQDVCLSGGSLMNKILAIRIVSILKNAGLNVYMPKVYPANDGGISYGQSIIGLAQELL